MKQELIKDIDTTSSQTIVKRSVWVVCPDSVRMGLSGENKPVAWFIHKHHAENFGQVMWEKFYLIEEVVIHCV